MFAPPKPVGRLWQGACITHDAKGMLFSSSRRRSSPGKYDLSTCAFAGQTRFAGRV